MSWPGTQRTGVNGVTLWSVSRLKKYVACTRAGAYRYALGIKEAEFTSTKFGKEVHRELDDWYTYGKLPRHAASMALMVTTPLAKEAERYSEIPLRLCTGAIDWIGFVDLAWFRGLVMVLQDWKTTSDKRYIMTVEQLREDLQARLYAVAAMDACPDLDEVTCRWVYLLTSNNTTHPVECTFTRAEVTEFRTWFDNVAAYYDGLQTRTKRGLMTVSELDTCRATCFKYPRRPCAYVDICDRPKDETGFKVQVYDMDFLKAIEAIQNGQTAPAPAVPSIPSIPAPPALPVAPPVPAVRPDPQWDAMIAEIRKEQEDLGLIGKREEGFVNPPAPAQFQEVPKNLEDAARIQGIEQPVTDEDIEDDLSELDTKQLQAILEGYGIEGVSSKARAKTKRLAIRNARKMGRPYLPAEPEEAPVMGCRADSGDEVRVEFVSEGASPPVEDLPGVPVDTFFKGIDIRVDVVGLVTLLGTKDTLDFLAALRKF